MSTPLLNTRTPRVGRIPPLQSGDRLSAEEFERRYDATPDLKKAELIDGVVYMPPPVSDQDHGAPHFDVIAWLGAYRWATPGVAGGDNSTLRLDPRNRPQPDAFLRVLAECGGRARVDPRGYIVSAPELIFEVAASSASYDLNAKLDVYGRHLVPEYVVWRVYDDAIDWLVLRGDRYEPLPRSADGTYRSEVLPGLWLDPAALIGGDVGGVERALRQGLATPEHASFCQRLAEARQRNAKS